MFSVVHAPSCVSAVGTELETGFFPMCSTGQALGKLTYSTKGQLQGAKWDSFLESLAVLLSVCLQIRC